MHQLGLIGCVWVWARRKVSSEHAQVQAGAIATAPEDSCKCNVSLKNLMLLTLYRCYIKHSPP